MELAEDGDESLIVDGLFLGRECAALAQGFEHIVDPGEGEGGMLCLDPLSMGIEFLGKRADACLLRFVAVRERESFKA